MDKKAHFKGASIIIGSLLFFGIWITPTLAMSPNDPQKEQWAYELADVYSAWDISTGSKDVVVAIIDNGFDHFHPDLRDNVWINTNEIANNGIDDDRNGYIDDTHGWNFADDNNNPRPDPEDDPGSRTLHHGTVIAGIIGAKGNNGADGVGILWDVSLMNIKIITNSGLGNLGLLSDAIYYAVDNGADVINMSLVGTDIPAGLVTAVEYAYTNGVVVVAAAGNNRTSLNQVPLYPICLDADASQNHVFGVNAIQQDRMLALFSNFGSDCIDITAPGVAISSTVRFSPKHDLPDRYTGGWSGTSFAAPFVSGAAALVKAVQPLWTPSQIFEAIMSNVSKTPPEDEEAYTNLFGAGLVQVGKAVAYAAEQEQVVPDVGGTVFTLNRVGALGTWELASDKRSLQTNQTLYNVDAVYDYTQDGEQKYAVTQYQDGQTIVAFFTANWGFERYWVVPTAGPQDIVVLDVEGTTRPEVFLSPLEADTVVVTKYSFYGDTLGVHSRQQAHNGVSLAVGEARSGGKEAVYATYNDGGVLAIFELNSSLDIVSSFDTDFPGDRASFGMGDIDADGEDEFVVGARAGTLPYLAYYERGGDLNQFFYAYSLSFTKGFHLFVTDDLVATAPVVGNQPVRIFTPEGEERGAWRPYGADYSGEILLLGIEE